jgi:NAD(P)-dependent dehydrogenase (short-subunit alcohol dehydrogenase family)
MAEAATGRRIALVTGASYGIGAASAVALARDGCDVAVTELDPADLAATARAVTAVGARAVPLALDVRSPAGIERALGLVHAAFGRLDVLVNNAGVNLTRAAVDVTEAEWDEVMSVNLKGTFFLTRAAGRAWIAAGQPGAIVSIASTHGVIGVAGRSTYGISKAGISQMTRMLAIEWAAHGIRVNAVAPGTVETRSRAAVFAAHPERRQSLMSQVPLGRFGTAEEMGAMVAYLAGPQAAFVTGQTILVDGGLTAH